jgi:hypothetical protein
MIEPLQDEKPSWWVVYMLDLMNAPCKTNNHRRSRRLYEFLFHCSMQLWSIPNRD